MVAARIAAADPEPRRPELDFTTVELQEDWDGWPTGTSGVIVDAYETKAIVEIAAPDGETLDILSVPYSAIRPVGAPTSPEVAF